MLIKSRFSSNCKENRKVHSCGVALSAALVFKVIIVLCKVPPVPVVDSVRCGEELEYQHVNQTSKKAEQQKKK